MTAGVGLGLRCSATGCVAAAGEEEGREARRERAAWEREEQGEATATRGGGGLREDRAGATAGEMAQVGRLG